MVEILVVVGIIALLTGILIPAVSLVRKAAKEAKERAQFTAISLGLEAFKNDFGDYPPSDLYTWTNDVSKANTAGAMKLAEALLGWDLMGVHPDTGWRVDGKNRSSYVDSTGTSYNAAEYFLYDTNKTTEMQKRKGRYVEIDVANPFRLGKTASYDGLFDLSGSAPFDEAAGCFVLCDIFGKGPSVRLSDGTHRKAGRPILYYRADPTQRFVTAGTAQTAYNRQDNGYLLSIIEDEDRDSMGAPRAGATYWNPLIGMSTFVNAIADLRVSTTDDRVPYRPDSYILISAGADGLYGTSDDIHNFGN
jgi:type II secretory pathway pseudopilin PulG